MILPAGCVVYSQDSEFVRRARAFLRSQLEVHHVDQPGRLDPVLQQNNPAVLLLALRPKESRSLLEQVQLEWPNVLILGFGTPRSEPLREAEQAGIYAPADVNLERHFFQGTIGRALDHLRILEENRALRAEAANVPALLGSRALDTI